MAGALLSVAGALVACGTSRQDQLEAVARDWCMTIRASQVIPVYPLTEDIQPGDVFLVQTTVDRQQQVYRRRGFLPLDNHIARISPGGYEEFYKNTFLKPGAQPVPTMPRHLQRKADGTSNWEEGPRAGFPSYSFSTSRGAGLSMAVPISGIPIGLSLLGSQSANGSVTIEGARTIGLDVVSLHEDVECWARDNRAFLSQFAPRDGSSRGVAGYGRPPATNYIRVISRVYLTGAVDIALSDARSFGGGGDAGLARPVDLLVPSTPTSLDDRAAGLANYRSAIASTNAMLAGAGTPVRRSGSNAGLSAAEVRAKTEEEQLALAEERARRATVLEESQTAFNNANTAAGPALKLVKTKESEVAAAEQTLADARAVAAATVGLPPEAPERVAALKAVAEAEAALGARRQELETARQDPKITERAQALGRLEVAKLGVDELTRLAPGGSVRVAAASSRFIALKQEFDPPLVIGYLAFDLEILEGGALGPPIPTHARLDRESERALNPPLPADRMVQTNPTPEATARRAAIREWTSQNPSNQQRADAERKRLFPERASMPYSPWLQSAGVDDLRCLMEALKIGLS
ncbi:MAG: hypothetical protein ACTS3F_04050 [Phycisphaerales bacterium]